MEHTNRPLDVALSQPDMFFAVETTSSKQHTTNGNFNLDPGGQLITKKRVTKLLSDAGQPIFFNEADGQIEIKGDGTVSTDIGQIGKLQTVTVDNVQRMIVTGDTLYRAPDNQDGNNGVTIQPVENPGIVQGALEKSNVNPISAMTQMIDVLRTYQSVTRSVESENERMRNMVNKLGDIRA